MLRRAIDRVHVTDDSLRGYAGYAVKRAFLTVKASVDAVLRPMGLRQVTFSALAVIDDCTGLRQTDLAQVLAMEGPNLALIVDEMVKAGWVRRDRDPSDRRAYALSLTDAGGALLARAQAAVATQDARLTEGLSAAERSALLRALRKVEGMG